MNVIELERWAPSEEDPRRMTYQGQRTAEEVFVELRHRLESMGLLPEEYFLMDPEWEDGRKVPEEADMFCTTDYGASEGVYLDVYLKWHEDGKPVIRTFITGKTLGERGDDLDRMFLISSAITKAFHGDRAAHARYMRVGSVEEDSGGTVLHLSRSEQDVLMDALLEQRERQEEAMSQTERLLRRMTGSVTAYMDAVGQRPLRMSSYDRAVLAIRDGELRVFQELCSKLTDQADGLLVEAAGRPGQVGRQMTGLVLERKERFPAEVYEAACKRAVDIADTEKVSFLLKRAETCAEGLAPSFLGALACYAHSDRRPISKEIVRQCTPEQIAAAPPELLERFARDRDYHTMRELVEKGISGGARAADILHMLTYQGRDNWMAKELLKARMWVDCGDFTALSACINNGAVDVAKVLLDNGMDFDTYREWAGHWGEPGPEENLQALAELKQMERETTAAGPQMGGPALG